MDELRIEYIDPAELQVDKGNPRKISKTAEAKLRAGLEHFGLVEPLVFNVRTDTLISGHQRRAQAIELGIKKVPVVLVDIIDEEAKALSLLLNNAKAQGTWDTDLLAARLDEIEAVDMLELSAFDVSDLDPANQADEVSFRAKGHGWTSHDHRIKCPKSKGSQCDICDTIRTQLESEFGTDEES